jgi:hypothetical protein
MTRLLRFRGELPRKEVTPMAELWTYALIALAALAWVRYAQHPTARNLRAAIAASLDL